MTHQTEQMQKFNFLLSQFFLNRKQLIGYCQKQCVCALACVCVCSKSTGSRTQKAQSAFLPRYIPTEAHSLGTEQLDMDKLCVLLLTLAALLPILAASVKQGAKGMFALTTSLVVMLNRQVEAEVFVCARPSKTRSLPSTPPSCPITEGLCV